MSNNMSGAPSGDEDPIIALLRQAGVRPEIDPLRRQRVEREVRRVWQEGLRRRRRRRWTLAMAACLGLMAIALLLRQLPPPPPVGDLAVVVHLQGRAFEIGSPGRRALSVGDRLATGAVIETAAGARLALSVERLASLRVDETSRLALEGPRSYSLLQGGIYLDSGDRGGDVEVRTPLLVARDVGTRFMVRHAASGESEVGVRDGSVAVRAAGTLRLDGGERLRIDQLGQQRRSTLAPHAADWDWARVAAVPFAAEGRPLAELLAWYAHEAGLRLELPSGGAALQRLQLPLQGDLAGLSADELLDIARAAGPLQLRIDRSEGVLHVE